ncbi:hypothetical protein GCM10027341_16740 [Spirosoma knui]
MPTGVTSLTIEARGAEGAGGSLYEPGKGAIITGTVSVTPGQQLRILVGEGPSSIDRPGAGGGGSFVVTGTNPVQPLVIAGGGGGGSGPSNNAQIFDVVSKQGQAGTNGGDGSGGGGGTNGSGGTIDNEGGGAGGGLYTNGGDGYFANGGGKAFVNGGQGGYGGIGGFGGGGTSYGYYGAVIAGGGGGYSGGGGGKFTETVGYGVGGGGGSFNIDPNGTAKTGAQNGNAGNGLVIISYESACSSFAATLNSNSPLNCERTSVRLSVPSAGNNATYVFSGPFPISQPTGTSSRTATVTNPGEYTVLVTNAQGCTATATTLVEANTDPPRNLSLSVSNVITCAQPTAVLNASANNNPGFVITGPGGQSYSANTATVSQPGEYTLTATRNNGCSATRTVTVETNTTPPQNVSLTNNGPLSCSQTSVNLSASSSTTGVAYGITGPEGFSASGGMTSVNRPGTYTLTATGANGCTAVQTTTVESNTITPSVSLTNSGPLSFTNASVTLTATATPGDNLSYSFSSNAAQQGSSNQAQVTTAGVYSVTVTRQDNGCSTIASTTVLGGNNPTVCRGGTAVISVAVEGDPVKYEWYKNTLTSPKLMETPQLFRGTATSSLTLINAQTNTQGNFYLKVTDRSGTVRVYGPYRLTVDASCRAREIASLETPLQVELAPNPIQQDRLRAVIRGAEGRPLQVELVDLSGKPVRQHHWQQADGQHLIDWDMQEQASGLYLLQVVSEGSAGLPTQRQSVKVVKP